MTNLLNPTKIALSGTIALITSHAFAAAPVVEIIEPTAENTVFSEQFPFQQPIVFTLETTRRPGGGSAGQDAYLRHLNDLDVQVDEVTIFSGGEPIGNPFNNDNACTPALLNESLACDPVDNQNAEVSVGWTVPQPGEYTIVVSAKVSGDLGEAEEVIWVEMLTAEYPAPPAVANAYLRAYPDLLAHKRHHGCVVSGIAEKHAKYSTFGDKGGPYNIGLIEAEVVSLAASCATKR